MREIRVRNGQRVRAGDVLSGGRRRTQRCGAGLLEDQLTRGTRASSAVHAETTLARRTSQFDPALATEPQRPSTWRASAPSSPRAGRHARRTDRRAADADARGACAGRGARAANRIHRDRRGFSPPRSWSSTKSWSKEGYVPRARLLPLQRADADYRSRAGRNPRRPGAGAPAGRRAGARMADARNQYQQAATDELKQSSADCASSKNGCVRPRTRWSASDPLAGRRRGHGMRVSRAGRSAGRRRADPRRGAQQRDAGGRGAHPSAGHQPRARRRPAPK